MMTGTTFFGPIYPTIPHMRGFSYERFQQRSTLAVYQGEFREPCRESDYGEHEFFAAFGNRFMKAAVQSTISKRYSSMTVFVSTSLEMCSSCFCASSRLQPSRFKTKNFPWRTSRTAEYPRPERACWMVCPWGSSTVRLGITQTCAFMRSV